MKKYFLTEEDLDALAKANSKVDQARAALFEELGKRLQIVPEGTTPTEPEQEQPPAPEPGELHVDWFYGESPRMLDAKIREALDDPDLAGEQRSKLVVNLQPGGIYDSIDVSGLMFSKNGKNYCGALMLFEYVTLAYYGDENLAPAIYGVYGEGPLEGAQINTLTILGTWLRRGTNAKACVLVKDMALDLQYCEIEGDDSDLCMWGIHSYRTPLHVESCRFYNFREHAIYAHHCPSATVERNEAFDCGRTAFQFARRGTQNELPETVHAHGKLRVAHNNIRRIGLDTPNGNGSAITFYGASRDGRIEVENNTIAGSNSGGIAILPEPGWNAVSQSDKLVWAVKQRFDVKSFKKDEGLFSGTDADKANSAWKDPHLKHWLGFKPQWWATQEHAIRHAVIIDNDIDVQTNRAIVEVSGVQTLKTDVAPDRLTLPSKWAEESCHTFGSTSVDRVSGLGGVGGGEI